jgi:hypothetical protein
MDNEIQYEVLNVNAGESYTKKLELKKNQRILYEFNSNRDLELHVLKGVFLTQKQFNN